MIPFAVVVPESSLAPCHEAQVLAYWINLFLIGPKSVKSAKPEHSAIAL
jgi:hypothetical protein